MEYLDFFSIIIIIVLLLTQFLINTLEQQKGENYRIIANRICFVITISICFYFGFRPLSAGSDTISYFRKFSELQTKLHSKIEHNEIEYEILFSCLFYFCAKYLNYKFFTILVSLLIGVGFYNTIQLFCTEQYRRFSVFFLVMFISLFSFSSIQANIIRNGLAISFCLPYIYYALHKKWKKAVVYAVCAILCHTSALLPIIAVIFICAIHLPTRVYTVGYFFCILLSYMEIGLHNMWITKFIPIERLQEYSGPTDEKYNIGFREDFVIYNTFFLILFLLLLNKKDKLSIQLYKLYCICSYCFFLSFHMPYSDRFGIYSWFLLPILLFYTCIKANNRYIIYYLTFLSSISYLVNTIPFLM